MFAWFVRHPPCLRRRVVVNLRGEEDRGLRGVLWDCAGDWYTLKHAEAIRTVLGVNGEEKEEAAPIVGEAVFHRSQLLFLQVLP
jgi:hypothetical protein